MRAAIQGRRKRNQLTWAQAHVHTMLHEAKQKGEHADCIAHYKDHDHNPRVQLLKPLTGDREGQTLLVGYRRVTGPAQAAAPRSAPA